MILSHLTSRWTAKKSNNFEVLPFYPSVDFRSSGRGRSRSSYTFGVWTAVRRSRTIETGGGQERAKPFINGGLRSHPDSPFLPRPAPISPSPSPSSLRQWRQAAQRNLRNQWSRLLGAKGRWLAAAAGRSHASALVNAHLSRRTCRGSAVGRARREEQCRDMLLSYYKEMVLAVSDLVKASRSMRCFSKASAKSRLVRFTDRQDDLNDSGDGGGAPVFRWFSMLEFDNLAQELVEMFVSELHLKRPLVLQLLSVNLKEGAEEHHT